MFRVCHCRLAREGDAVRRSVTDGVQRLAEGTNDDMMSPSQASARLDAHVGETRARRLAMWSTARIAW